MIFSIQLVGWTGRRVWRECDAKLTTKVKCTQSSLFDQHEFAKVLKGYGHCRSWTVHCLSLLCLEKTKQDTDSNSKLLSTSSREFLPSVWCSFFMLLSMFLVVLTVTCKQSDLFCAHACFFPAYLTSGKQKKKKNENSFIKILFESLIYREQVYNRFSI